MLLLSLTTTRKPDVQTAWGTVIAETGDTCIVNAGADSYRAMARWLLLIGVRLTVLELAELRTAFTNLAADITRIENDDPTGEDAT